MQDGAGAWQTVPELQAAMGRGEIGAVALVEAALARIEARDRRGPCLRAVVETNPDAAEIAAALDAERRAAGPRGPLHGIPVLLKDNIDTADRMMTTAGSLALVGPAAKADASVGARLREAGAVILGKTNLSEWANFRGHRSTSGWSARGGLTRNPHALDRSAGGSSSGSGAAVAAGYVPVAVGTETDGSIVSPASACGVVGIKPTVGLTSRAGVVPISNSQDSVGPLAATVADAASVLRAMCALGPDPRDPAAGRPEARAVARALGDGGALLDRGGLRGARLGVARAFWGRNRHADAVAEAALRALDEAGAELVDPADIPTLSEMRADRSELEVMLFEFRSGLEAYLAQRPGLGVRTVADVIAFNEAHAEAEMPYFGQELLALAEGARDEAAYRDARARSRDLGGRRGIDAVLDEHRLDALVAPTAGPAWTSDLLTGDHGTGGSSQAAARAGYPLVSVPAGAAFGLPINITFMGRAWSEPALIRLAFAFEQATTARRRPRFRETAELV